MLGLEFRLDSKQKTKHSQNVWAKSGVVRSVFCVCFQSHIGEPIRQHLASPRSVCAEYTSTGISPSTIRMKITSGISVELC